MVTTRAAKLSQLVANMLPTTNLGTSKRAECVLHVRGCYEIRKSGGGVVLRRAHIPKKRSRWRNEEERDGHIHIACMGIEGP